MDGEEKRMSGKKNKKSGKEKDKAEKTNAVRLIESAGLDYEINTYETKDGLIDAVSVAKKVGMEPERCFKTLVTVSSKGEHYVMVVPGNGELDLKKAAKFIGEKKLEMIKQKDLLPLTGYVHGGCSPIGMKKQFVTVIDESALDHETIGVSAGKVGAQVVLAPEDLALLTSSDFGEISKK